MSKMNKQEKFSTPVDKRCIWMQAGVMKYKLCSMEFECEKCALDKVLRGELLKNTIDDSTASALEIKSFELQDIMDNESLIHRHDYDAVRVMHGNFSKISYSPDVRYCSCHIWFKEKRNGVLRIGTDDFLARCLEPVRNAVLPNVGDDMTIGKTFCWLILDDATVRLDAPFSGRVTAINHTVLQNPKCIQTDSHGKGWLLEVETISPPSSALVGDVREWFKNNLRQVFHEISKEIDRCHPKTGETMADGGELVTNIRHIVGKERYMHLIGKLLRMT